jgi:ABC-type sulfate transport system permease subunit
MQQSHAIRIVADRLLAAKRNLRLAQLAEFGLAALIALVLLPIATIALLAFNAPSGVFSHLASTILPRVLTTTTLVLLGTGVLTLVVGTLAAWAVTLHTFPGRAMIERALLAACHSHLHCGICVDRDPRTDRRTAWRAGTAVRLALRAGQFSA